MKIKTIIILVISLIFIGCNKPIYNNSTIVDSVKYINTIDSLNFIIDNLVISIDTLNKEIEMTNYQLDSINEQLFIVKYKLERIDYYNKIAANGNNIKFLRGWINRTLKDHE